MTNQRKAYRIASKYKTPESEWDRARVWTCQPFECFSPLCLKTETGFQNLKDEVVPISSHSTRTHVPDHTSQGILETCGPLVASHIPDPTRNLSLSQPCNF